MPVRNGLIPDGQVVICRLSGNLVLVPASSMNEEFLHNPLYSTQTIMIHPCRGIHTLREARFRSQTLYAAKLRVCPDDILKPYNNLWLTTKVR
jgi:hypothetical protein